jgi:hypothetical protein
MFNAASAEFHNLDVDIWRRSTAQKQLLTEVIGGILERLSGRNAATRTARQCRMLLDGALVGG